MRPIPIKLRVQLDALPRMHKCCICGNRIVQWHHVWTYAGKQINELWAILAICNKHHERARDSETRKEIEKISLSFASREDLEKYPKKDWDQIKINLGFYVYRCCICKKKSTWKMNGIYRNNIQKYYCDGKKCQKRFIEDAGDLPDNEYYYIYQEN